MKRFALILGAVFFLTLKTGCIWHSRDYGGFRKTTVISPLGITEIKCRQGHRHPQHHTHIRHWCYTHSLYDSCCDC